MDIDVEHLYWSWEGPDVEYFCYCIHVSRPLAKWMAHRLVREERVETFHMNACMTYPTKFLANFNCGNQRIVADGEIIDSKCEGLKNGKVDTVTQKVPAIGGALERQFRRRSSSDSSRGIQEEMLGRRDFQGITKDLANADTVHSGGLGDFFPNATSPTPGVCSSDPTTRLEGDRYGVGFGRFIDHNFLRCYNLADAEWLLNSARASESSLMACCSWCRWDEQGGWMSNAWLGILALPPPSTSHAYSKSLARRYLSVLMVNAQIFTIAWDPFKPTPLECPGSLNTW
ncbi:hypothetical protein EDC04DRAFT_2602062 [Pisolithus marmoratus]|nr:hypothetical protein EDC04DRAFT_2602062 [Pisolithus marmoratus]